MSNMIQDANLSAPSKNTNYNKIRETYLRYLESYKLLNNGSTKGVTPFKVFYMNSSYEQRYFDLRNFFMVSIR